MPATTTRIETRLVNPSSSSAFETISSPFRLGPLDSLVPVFIPIAVVFIYSSSATSLEGGHTVVIEEERLATALAKLLDYYPQLSGRLNASANDGTPAIDRLGSGAELVLAACSSPLEAFSTHSSETGSKRILLSRLPEQGNALLPPYSMDIQDVCKNPIFTVQHTRFSCGSVALGIRTLHTICDAEGYFQLARDLAEIYRQLGKTNNVELEKRPGVKPYLEGMSVEDITRQEERKKALEYQPEFFYTEQDPPASVELPEPAPANPYANPYAGQAQSSPPPPVTGRCLRFSADSLNRIKDLASPPSGSGWVSSYTALAALLCQFIYRARLKLRELQPDIGELSPPDFLTPINIRSRLGTSHTGESYFPNTLLTSFTALPPDTLATQPLWETAKQLHDLINCSSFSSPSELEKTVRWIAAQPDKKKIRQRFRPGNGAVMISQWSKMNMYTGTAFESAPVLVAPPFTDISLIDGLGYTLPTEGARESKQERAGEVDVYLALSDPVWDILLKDEGFSVYLEPT